jgi:hypothetical protein
MINSKSQIAADIPWQTRWDVLGTFAKAGATLDQRFQAD